MKIAIIGASGFLGTKLMNVLSKEHEVIGTYSNNKKDSLLRLDATNEIEVKQFLLKNKPELVIDTIALTSSVVCEKDPSLCEALNYKTAKNILEACKIINAKMVFFSSTYIFDGEKGNYNEEDTPNPLNEYGKKKVMAEKELLNYPSSIILRVDIMYGFNGKNEENGVFGGSILEGNKVELRIPDQVRTPLFVDDVPRAILFLVEKNQTGIFNLAGKDKIKMIDFLKDLERIVRKDSLVTSAISNEKSLVKTPLNSTLNISKIERLGFKPHSLKEGLKLLENQFNLSRKS